MFLIEFIDKVLRSFDHSRPLGEITGRGTVEGGERGETGREGGREGERSRQTTI